MRIGVFGGSFDPIHLGHLILAEQCREQARLDQVWFIPSATSPLKRHGPRAGNRQRLEMLQLAIAGNDAFQAVDCELQRGGVSYTVETLRQLTADHAGHEWFLLIGADALADFGQWREPETICQLATPLVYARAGSDRSLDSLRHFVNERRLLEIQSAQFETPQIEISSSDLRQRRASGRSLRFLVPRAIEAYIAAQNLYGSEAVEGA